MPKKRKKQREEKYSERLVTGLGVSFTCIAALLAAFALMIKNGKLDSDASNWIVIAVNILSALLCGLTVTPKGKGNIIYNGLIPGIILGAIITLLSLIVGSEAFSINNSIEIMLISAVSSTIGSIIKLCNSNKKCHR